MAQYCFLQAQYLSGANLSLSRSILAGCSFAFYPRWWLKSCKSVCPPSPPPQEDDLSHRSRLYGSHIPAAKWSRQSRPPGCWRGSSAGCARTKKGKLVSSDADSGIYVMLSIFGQNTFGVGPPVRQMYSYCSNHTRLSLWFQAELEWVRYADALREATVLSGIQPRGDNSFDEGQQVEGGVSRQGF